MARAETSAAPPLSERERQIAKLYVAGRSYKEIARDLALSPATVRTHLNNVFRKLEVANRIQLLHRLGTEAPEPMQALRPAAPAADRGRAGRRGGVGRPGAAADGAKTGGDPGGGRGRLQPAHGARRGRHGRKAEGDPPGAGLAGPGSPRRPLRRPQGRRRHRRVRERRSRRRGRGRDPAGDGGARGRPARGRADPLPHRHQPRRRGGGRP